MELPKDVYEYLIQFSNDQDVLNMLSVNKKFSDPIFFERILKKRYPFLLKYKTEDVSWRQFYVSMIYYISKMKELFSFPGFSIENFDPEKMEQGAPILDEVLDAALGTNNLNFIRTFIQKMGHPGILQTLRRPVKLKKPLLDFIRDSDFGVIRGSKIQIQELLSPFLEEGILSKLMLALLLKIYLKKYKGIPDENMRKYLGVYLPTGGDLQIASLNIVARGTEPSETFENLYFDGLHQFLYYLDKK